MLHSRMKKSTLQKARQLRRNLSPANKAIWDRLKSTVTGPKFVSQEPLLGWIADFFCLDSKLIVEIDGPYHQTAEGLKADVYRDAIFARSGFTTLRYRVEDALAEPDRIVEEIRTAAGYKPKRQRPVIQYEDNHFLC